VTLVISRRRSTDYFFCMAVINKMINNMIMQKDIPQAYWHDYGGGGVPQAYSDSDDDDDALMFSRGSRGPSSVRPAAPSVVSGSSTAASAFAMARPVVATVADSFVTAVSSAVRTVRTVISGPAAPVTAFAPVEAFSGPVTSGSGDVSDTGLAFSEPVEPGSVFSTRQVLDHLKSEAVGGFYPVESESDFGEPVESVSGFGDLSDTVSGYGDDAVLYMHSIDEEDELTSDIADSAPEEEWAPTDEDEEEGGDFQYEDEEEAIEWAERQQSDPEFAALVDASIGRSPAQPVNRTQAFDRLTVAVGGMNAENKAEVMGYLSGIQSSDMAAIAKLTEDSIQEALISVAKDNTANMRWVRQAQAEHAELTKIVMIKVEEATDHEKAGMTSNPLDVVQQLQSAMKGWDPETRRNVMAALNDKMKLGDFDKIMARKNLSDVLLDSLLPAP